MTALRINGISSFLPRTRVASDMLDARFDQVAGWTEETFGIAARHVAEPDETSSAMGAEAARGALAQAGWATDDFDVLIGACGVMEQPIPSTAALIQRQLGLGRSGIPAFDVNQTCLSFLAALDVAAMGLETGRWRRVLIVSADIASAGLDPATPQTMAIFGDGAAAVCIERSDDHAGPALLARGFETYAEGADLATLRAGGTRLRVEEGYDALVAGSRFHMDAFGIFKAAARCLPALIDRVLADAGLSRDTVDCIVPHQASAPGLEHIRRLFPGDPARVVDIFANHGNQIAASLPTALASAINSGRLQPGSTVLLLGTAAGISAGAMVLRL